MLWSRQLQAFLPGQRWVSAAEPDLGLGTVTQAQGRTVTLVFPASGETRLYSRQSAPLSRVRFAPGDEIRDDHGNALRVVSVTELNGLLDYRVRDPQGGERDLSESHLDSALQLNRPGQRLFSHQFDTLNLFELRRRSWEERFRLAQSPLYGLTGCRTSLLAHQLYIAHEVAGRYAPRVLLADEVGLGKTIEAGLILHQQLLTERARRVLILVPESLLHQWLLEMLRRFNLMFRIFDRERCQALEQDAAHENLFHSEQLVLCSQEFLVDSPHYSALVLRGEWDLLVVDEAHHLQWSERQASPAYRLVEQLAAITPGVLLLTATPEQLGRSGHFARLRLLDPHRFPDPARFRREETDYAPVARAVESLFSRRLLDPPELEVLQRFLHADTDSSKLLGQLQTASANADAARHTLIARLLDRHGTGRILFRNTRATVQGFPERALEACPLPLPAQYAQCLGRVGTDAEATRLVTPERLYSAGRPSPDWTQVDPRVSWLVTRLRALKTEKALVIAADARTVIELAEALQRRHGIHAAVFHEGLSLLERDRAAAFFAATELGAQVMICSEIGSEGRNFQFAHHLVLFDLPLHPDLLEQRIGRLDRIGQRQTVNILVPYLLDSAQAVLFQWYDRALGAFTRPCPAGAQLYAELGPSLMSLCRTPAADPTSLITAAAARREMLDLELRQGRDRLLEYNSCRQPQADRLCAQAREIEDSARLNAYVEALLDVLGVEVRLLDAGCAHARPGEHLLMPLPGLDDSGVNFTCDRDTALAMEDVQYFSWEHPLVRDSMDMLLTGELGNCMVSAAKCPGVQPGTLLVECLYIFEGGHRQLNRPFHLPPVLLPLALDEQGRERDAQALSRCVTASGSSLDKDTAGRVIQARETVLRRLLQRGEALARERGRAVVEAASQARRDLILREIERLEALSRVNPAVRAEETEYFRRQLHLLNSVVQSIGPRLDAIRVVVAT